MSVPEPACTSCGKHFTTDDLRAVACKHCGTVLAHHQRAAQQVAVIQQMMADRNGNGIPDVYEGLVANAHDNAARHMQANVMGMPQPSPHAAYPPPAGGFGAAPPAPYAPMAPMGAAPAAAAGAAVGGAMVAIILVVVGLMLAFMAAGFAFFFLLRG